MPPRGVLPRTFSWLLGVAAVWAVLSSHFLLDHVLPDPYASMYSILLEVQLVILLTVGTACVYWYSRCLTEFKRECLAVEALRGR